MIRYVFSYPAQTHSTCSSSSPARSGFVSFSACIFLIRSCLSEQKCTLFKSNYSIWLNITPPWPPYSPCIDLQSGLQYLSSLLSGASKLLGAEEVACSTHLQHCDHSWVGVQPRSQLEARWQKYLIGNISANTDYLTWNWKPTAEWFNSTELICLFWSGKNIWGFEFMYADFKPYYEVQNHGES